MDEQIQTSESEAKSNSSQPTSPPPKTSRMDLLSGPITPTLWKFALPLMFSFLVNSLYSWIDAYFVSRLGTEAIAAIGFCEQIGFFIFTLASGFSVGTGIIVARRIGEGNRKAAEDISLQALTFMLAFSSIIAIILLASISNILQFLNLQGKVLEMATAYMSTLLFGVPGNLLIFQVNSTVRSTGNSMFAMKVLLMTTAMNALLAPVLIFGFWIIPAMGMAGAGLATAAAEIFGGIVSLYVLFSGGAGLKIPFHLPSLDWKIIGSIAKLGFASSLQMFVVSISRMTIFQIANKFGTAVVASYTLGLRVDFLVFMPIFSMGVAMETITGQHLGAKKVERIFKFYRAAILQMLMLVGTLGVLVYFFGGYYAQIFTNDISVIEHTKLYLRILAFGYPLFLIGIVSTRMISGAGAAVRSMAIIIGSTAGIQLPLCYFLAHYSGWNEAGLWLGLVLGYLGMAIISFLNVRKKKWLTAKV